MADTLSCAAAAPHWRGAALRCPDSGTHPAGGEQMPAGRAATIGEGTETGHSVTALEAALTSDGL